MPPSVPCPGVDPKSPEDPGTVRGQFNTPPPPEGQAVERPGAPAVPPPPPVGVAARGTTPCPPALRPPPIKPVRPPHGLARPPTGVRATVGVTSCPNVQGVAGSTRPTVATGAPVGACPTVETGGTHPTAGVPSVRVGTGVPRVNTVEDPDDDDSCLAPWSGYGTDSTQGEDNAGAGVSCGVEESKQEPLACPCSISGMSVRDPQARSSNALGLYGPGVCYGGGLGHLLSSLQTPAPFGGPSSFRTPGLLPHMTGSGSLVALLPNGMPLTFLNPDDLYSANASTIPALLALLQDTGYKQDILELSDDAPARWIDSMSGRVVLLSTDALYTSWRKSRMNYHAEQQDKMTKGVTPKFLARPVDILHDAFATIPKFFKQGNQVDKQATLLSANGANKACMIFGMKDNQVLCPEAFTDPVLFSSTVSNLEEIDLLHVDIHHRKLPSADETYNGLNLWYRLCHSKRDNPSFHFHLFVIQHVWPMVHHWVLNSCTAPLKQQIEDDLRCYCAKSDGFCNPLGSVQWGPLTFLVFIQKMTLDTANFRTMIKRQLQAAKLPDWPGEPLPEIIPKLCIILQYLDDRGTLTVDEGFEILKSLM